MKVFYTVLRILLGALFIFSGYVKAVDPWGTAIKFDEYFEAMHLNVFHFLSFSLANFLSILELLVGYLLLFNIQQKWASRMAFFLMLLFTPLTLWLAVTQKVTDCGCFGDAVKLTDWETFYKNIVLLTIAIFVLSFARKFPAVINLKKQRLLFILGFLFSAGVVFYSYQHLPLIDFRPFKIGSDIKKGMEIPENAPIAKYRTKLKYEKDGNIKEFTQENYPWQDTTWHFVSSSQILIQKGYTPPIQDFYIESVEGEDITENILAQDVALIIVSYKIEKTDFTKEYHQKYLQKIVNEANNKNIPVYLFTASIFDQVANLRSYISENIQFCFADEKMLKTMIRANPGVILLNKGIVANKWNINDLFGQIEFHSKINDTSEEVGAEKNYKYQIYRSLFIFIILIIITLIIIVIKNPKTDIKKNEE